MFNVNVLFGINYSNGEYEQLSSPFVHGLCPGTKSLDNSFYSHRPRYTLRLLDIMCNTFSRRLYTQECHFQ